MKKYELLCPAGSFPSLIAAVENGADAVYFGLKDVNMRDNAKNFTLKDLDKIRKICQKGNKKVKMYLTLNTIIYDFELRKIEGIIKKIKGKVDAVICWDFSVIRLCKKYKIPFHISTQASVSNLESARFYKKLGAERIVLARELNLKQVKKISKEINIEYFAHGAMCVSVSGRCFTSQFLQNMSANRGQCCHPCRRSYIIKDEDGYELKLENNKVMSAKDLCTLPFIEEMKKAGIKSFKIEGRNRNPEYVAAVAKVYRKALDKKLTRQEIKQGINKLKKVYNRDFSSGFLFRVPGPDGFSFSESGEQEENKVYIGKIEKYWARVNVSHLKMHSGKLKIGDEIYIIGNQTGVKREKITSMEIDSKQVKEVKKGQDVGILLKAKRGDCVYLIKRK